MYPELSEEERFPILTPAGRKLLHQMRQHALAPMWNWPNGEQLDQSGLVRVQAFGEQLSRVLPYSTLDPPDWIRSYVARCLREVPFYRQRSREGTDFFDLPTTRRADLAPRAWEFVPDCEPSDSIIVFSSSGTTGYPTRTPHHPYSAACGIPLIEHALKSLHGISLLRGPDVVAITNVAAYPGAFTTAIVIAYLQEAGCVRVNLDPSAWRDPEHCSQYINSWKAPIWLGDPVAFGAMEKLDVDYKPQAIVSSIMHLADAYRDHLSQKYQCPVVDLYAMTEAGIIAARDDHGHRVLSPDLHVEILDLNDRPCRPGERGEITLTGGRNPYLPLLRYRTGDFASMELVNGNRVLIGLEGRQPQNYLADNGRTVHSMELTRLMRKYPVLRYKMNAINESNYQLLIKGDIDRASLQKDLESLFGSNVSLAFET